MKLRTARNNPNRPNRRPGARSGRASKTLNGRKIHEKSASTYCWRCCCCCRGPCRRTRERWRSPQASCFLRHMILAALGSPKLPVSRMLLSRCTTLASGLCLQAPASAVFCRWPNGKRITHSLHPAPISHPKARLTLRRQTGARRTYAALCLRQLAQALSCLAIQSSAPLKASKAFVLAT